MTTRIWTLEALDAAHPEVKAAGWAWGLSGSEQEPYALLGDSRIIRATNGRIRQIERVGGKWLLDVDVDGDVALAVLLACRGLDSLGTMVEQLEVEEKNHRAWAGPTTPTGAANNAHTMAESAAVADAYADAASLLRGSRGTVQSR